MSALRALAASYLTTRAISTKKAHQVVGLKNFSYVGVLLNGELLV